MKKLILLTLPFATLMFGVLTIPVYAQINQEDKDQVCAGFGSGECSADASNDFNDLWASILNIFSFVVGAIAVLMIIVGALRYVLSNGDPQGTQNAKNTILYAIVGLVIALVAQAIVLFILTNIDT